MCFYKVQRRLLSLPKYKNRHFEVWGTEEPWLILVDNLEVPECFEELWMNALELKAGELKKINIKELNIKHLNFQRFLNG